MIYSTQVYRIYSTGIDNYLSIWSNHMCKWNECDFHNGSVNLTVNSSALCAFIFCMNKVGSHKSIDWKKKNVSDVKIAWNCAFCTLTTAKADNWLQLLNEMSIKQLPLTPQALPNARWSSRCTTPTKAGAGMNRKSDVRAAPPISCAIETIGVCSIGSFMHFYTNSSCAVSVWKILRDTEAHVQK